MTFSITSNHEVAINFFQRCRDQRHRHDSIEGLGG